MLSIVFLDLKADRLASLHLATAFGNEAPDIYNITMSEGEIDVLHRIEISAFDREISTKRQDEAVRRKADKKFLFYVRQAYQRNIPQEDVNRAETLGRLKAAMEEGDEEMVRFYEQVLEDQQTDGE